jgi:hypothetical protein
VRTYRGNLGTVTPRSRALAFGSAGVLVLAGVLCLTLIAGSTGEILATALMSVGLVGAVVLVFLEVGLSEDRARAREEKEERRRADPPARRPLRRLPRRRG